MENRMKEIKQRLTAFDKNVYTKKEVLEQLFALQAQMGEEIPDLLSTSPNPRVFNVYNYLKKWNAECGNIADAELEEFRKQTVDFNERIRAEISGIEGERKAYKSLQTIKRPCKLLHNVELRCEDHVSEIDIVAVIDGAVFLIEVKNTQRDVIIDEKGNFKKISVSGNVVSDKNIGIQMNEKEYVVRAALKRAGLENVNVQSLVVFTNSNTNVDNRYPYIKECYLSDLPHIIETYEPAAQYPNKMRNQITSIILAARSEESWPVKIDIPAYKTAFATLLAKLQTAPTEQTAKTIRFSNRLTTWLSGLFNKSLDKPCNTSY